jgi:hypothetical protein
MSYGATVTALPWRQLPPAEGTFLVILYQKVYTYTHANTNLNREVHLLRPDGNRLEICSQEMPPADAKQFLHDARTVGDVMKQLDLETAGR